MTLLARSVLTALALTAVTACSSADDGAVGGTSAAAAPTPTASAPAAPTPPTPGPVPGTTGSASATPVPAEAEAAPLAPAPGPPVVRTTPTGPPEPGTLQVVDWGARAGADSDCEAGRADPVSFGDMDADGRDEAAVPVSCRPGEPATEVLVYAGDPGTVRLLGRALSREQQEQVHAVEFREPHLVVTTLAHSGADRSGEPDLAVTTRWVVRAGVLERTDRYEDPAFVLETDEE